MRLSLIFVVLICFVMVGSALAVDRGDLSFYFSFDQLDGKTFVDESGKEHKGEIHGNIKLVDEGKLGKAAKFEMTDYIDLDGVNFPAEDIPIDELTLCAWVNCERTGDHHEIFNARASDSTWLIHPELRSEGDFRWLLRTDGGTTIFEIRAGVVEWAQWIHFAGVYNGKTGTLYINGENISEVNGSGTIAKDWGLGARIGRTIDDARPFTGLMDDISLWKVALTQEEIKTIMEKGTLGILEGEAVSPSDSLVTSWGKLKAF